MLPRAAAWLHERFGAALGEVVVATPTARAGRRLLELLLEAAPRQALMAPRIVTAGQLPELLFDGGDDAAGDLEARCARVRSLRQAERSVLEAVVAHPPGAGDIVGWWSLAEQLETVSSELAAGRLAPAEVRPLAAQRGVDLGLSDPRWAALEQLEAAYRSTLGRADRQSARLAAVGGGHGRSDGPIVLVGMVDLSPLLEGLLEKSGQVVSLIHAPESEAGGLDALGGLRIEAWEGRDVVIEDLRLAEDPTAEAVTVVQRLAELPEGTQVESVAVGLGDEARAWPIARALEQAGVAARPAAGRSSARSAPALLLGALGEYVNRRRFSDLAALVRHPDVEVYLGGDASWPRLLDEHAARHLQAELDGAGGDSGGPGDAGGEAAMRGRLDELRRRIDKLMPDDAPRHRPLDEWSEAMAASLEAVYGRAPLDRHADHDLVEVLGQIGTLLREQAQLDGKNPCTPRVDLAEAIALTLLRLAGAVIAQPGGAAAVELLGFLEMPLDDSAHAVITGLNEGVLPRSDLSDAFLPESLRAALGLPDGRRRFARDKLLLMSILASRGSTTLIACRRSAEGDPLMPTRLILACDDDTLVARIRAFYSEAPPDAGRPPLLLIPGGSSRFLIPRPLLDPPRIERLRVTAFRDYLACPFRFYLRHVAKLSLVDDRAGELDALAFGTLTHGLLEAFGRHGPTESTHPEQITRWLDGELDRQAGRQFGQRPRPAVRIQLERLRARMRGFAVDQARLVSAGWRIRADLIEKEHEVSLDVDGQPFILSGKIDRIDEHHELGFRVFDYKSSDSAATPEAAHRRGPKNDKQWVDLQLPLYRMLCKPLGVSDPQLGYFNLPRKSEKTNVMLAAWQPPELREAALVRDGVIRDIRAGRFWPPTGDVPRHTDPFARICADRTIDRAALIARSGP